MVNINGTTITMTKGDSLAVQLHLTMNGEAYFPQDNDVIRFAMKKRYTDDEPLIYKIIPNDTLILKLESEDTKNLAVSQYIYDIQITYANGDVNTFITEARFILRPEVE